MKTPSITAAFAVVSFLAFFATPAVAAERSPWWHLTSSSRPTNLSVGPGRIVITAANLGDADAHGETSPIMISDHLPHGITAESVEAAAGERGELPEPECAVLSKSSVACRFEHDIPPFSEIEVRIGVQVAADASPTNELSARGGGGGEVSLKRALSLSSDPTPFGVADYGLALEEPGGTPDSQAGSHPFQMTTTVILNQNGRDQPAVLPKDLSFNLPPGLIGNPTPFAQCTPAQFSALQSQCPARSVVGVVIATFEEPALLGIQTAAVPIYNLEPDVGEPARFGFRPTAETAVFVDTSVRTGRDYGVTATVHNVTQQVGVLSSQVTLWGVPGAAVHDGARGEDCLHEARHIEANEPCRPLDERDPPPFLALPTSCPRNPVTSEPEPLQTSGEADSWRDPGLLVSFQGDPMPAMDNCNQLPFSPRIHVTPDTSAASAPSGLDVNVHLDQETLLSSEGLAESAVKDITVALPEGLTVNPSSAGGLDACSEGEVGFNGKEPASGALLFTPTAEKPSCPDAAKVGNVQIKTPLLPPSQSLKGAVYLAGQNANPFGSLLAIYMIAEDPVSGVLVKLAGEVHVSPTGQIVTTFENTPQVAFEDANVEFYGGSRAALATPPRCGSYTTTASIVPWAAESSSEQTPSTVQTSATFAVTSGPGGSPCPGTTLPFSPALTGGSTNIGAGSFTPVTTTISRGDGQQDLRSVHVRLPAGLAGLIASVTPCAEAQANDGTCGPGSLLGESTVTAGVGPDPVTVPGGKVYITGPYRGAPFGLAIVSPVKAGPLDLEHDTSNPSQNPPCDCIVVRAKLEVDPHTAEVTVTTDDSGPHAIPRSVDGIGVQLRQVNVTVNRPNFAFNPTNCSPLHMTGGAEGFEGGTATFASPFQITNCSALRFTPTLTVKTNGKGSRPNGTAMTFKIAYPKGALGKQSWFSEAKFDIPSSLPVRLGTIQQACRAEVFEHSRADCPKHSIIGHAIVRTPVLPVPLQGPVYFISYGNAKFPSAVLVLSGDNVTVELRGETFINSKSHITSATFAGTPDVPFDSIEVTLPSGPFSEFAVSLPEQGDYNLCGHKVVMPTLFKAQNGLEIRKRTSVTLTGCPRAKHRKQRHRGRHSRKSTKPNKAGG